MTAATWYLPTCPHWCDRGHGGTTILTPDGDPASYDCAATQPWVCHSRPLTPSAAGLTVTLTQWEGHPDAEPITAEPLTVVSLPAEHDTEGVAPATLRAWAAVLLEAAAEAEALTGGEDR